MSRSEASSASMCPWSRPGGVVALVLVALTLLPALAVAREAPTPIGSQAPAAQNAVAAAAGGDLQGGVIDRILVKVNGAAILHSEYEEGFAAQLAIIEGQVPPEQLEAQLPQFRLAFLASMVDNLMIKQRAEELGIIANANDIDRALANLMEANGITSQEQLEQALAAEGLTLAELRQSIGDNLVQQRLLYDQVQRQIFVSEREIIDYYEENLDDFTEPAKVLFRQMIFILEGPDRDALLRRAQAAVNELRGGVALTAVAARYPEAQAPSNEQGDWVALEDLQPAIAAAIEGMSPNSYSDPIEGRFGYHIVQLLDRTETTTQPLEEVQAEVRQILMQRKGGQRLEAYTGELRARSHLEVFADEFAELEAQWQDAGTADPSRRGQ